MAPEHDRELERAQAALLERCAPEASVRRVRWRGGETQVVELGDGPPLVLLHGGGDAGFNWFPVLAPLAQGRRVVVVDRPGHGLADPYEYRGVDLGEHVTAFLTDLLDDLGVERAELGGCSMGGAWALVFALESPNRVERVSLVGATPGLTGDVPWLLRLAFGLPLGGRAVGRRLLANPTPESCRAFWGRLLVAQPERLADDFLAVDVAHMRRNRESVVSLMCEAVTLRGLRKKLVLGERLRELAVPTLALFGDRDRFLPPSLWRAWETLAGESPCVELRRVPGAGHVLWLDEPERVVAELDRFHTRLPLRERSTR